MAFLQNLAYYQSGLFAILSLRAWNAWWLIQSMAGGGDFIVDNVPFLGPITLRMVGYVVTGLVSLIVARRSSATRSHARWSWGSRRRRWWRSAS